MKPSRIVLLLVALLAGGLAAFLATRGDQSAPVSAAPEIVEEARAQILVAKQAIGIGERLTANSLEWQEWPAGAVRPEYITVAATPEAITDMAGAVARFEFFAGEPIREQKLVRAEQGYLSAVLDKGMRGVSVSVTADSASGGFIVPNDHVDVVLTRAGTTGQISETILSNVRVLAINARLGEVGATGAQAEPDNPRTEVFASTAIATLELNPVQGETIINGASIGKLSLVLRSIVDFPPGSDTVEHRSNQAIQVIRYGQQVNVMAGTAQSDPATEAAFDPASLAHPITIAPAPGIGAIPIQSAVEPGPTPMVQ